MAANNRISREVVLGLLEKFPNTPTLTLAKKAYKENKALWSNVEACRGQIRQYRGAHGKSNRGKMLLKDHYRKPGKSGEMLFPRLPASLDGADGYDNFIVDTPGPWGILGDLHIPYHNLPALRAALKEGKRRGWKGILINGDLFDMPGAFSKFDHDPRKSDFARDLYMGRQFLDALKEAFPKARLLASSGYRPAIFSSSVITTSTTRVISGANALNCSTLRRLGLRT